MCVILKWNGLPLLVRWLLLEKFKQNPDDGSVIFQSQKVESG